LFYRNTKSGRYVGSPHKISVPKARFLAEAIRQRGYNSMVVRTSDGNSRIYVGSKRYDRRKMTDDVEKALPGAAGGFWFSERLRPNPSNAGLEDERNFTPRVFKVLQDFYDWKNTSYKKSDDLRWVAIGFVDKEDSTQDGFLKNENIGLMGVGLMPSNIAKKHLKDLGFDVNSDSAIGKWYGSERKSNGELWHAQNEDMYDELETMNPTWQAQFLARDVTGRLNVDGQEMVYAISDDLDSEDGYIMFENGLIEKDRPIEAGFNSETLMTDNVFLAGDLDARARMLRRWLPQIDSYLPEYQVDEFIRQALLKTSSSDTQFGNALTRYAQPEPLEYGDEVFPDQEELDKTNRGLTLLFGGSEAWVSPPSEIMRRFPLLAEETKRMFERGIGYDFLNLQGVSWLKAPNLVRYRTDTGATGLTTVATDFLDTGVDLITDQPLAEVIPYGLIGEGNESTDPSFMKDKAAGIQQLAGNFLQAFYDGEPTDSAIWNID